MYAVYCRELQTPTELKKLMGKECLCKGTVDSVVDSKYQPNCQGVKEAA